MGIFLSSYVQAMLIPASPVTAVIISTFDFIIVESTAVIFVELTRRRKKLSDLLEAWYHFANCSELVISRDQIIVMNSLQECIVPTYTNDSFYFSERQ